MSFEEQKRAAACRAAALVEDGMLVGLGTGSTVGYLFDELVARDVVATYVATSARTEAEASRRGFRVLNFHDTSTLDLAIDGADQVTAQGWLVKGAGGALTREKIVASAATRYVVIVDKSKLVDALHSPVPVELMNFGLAATLARLGAVRVRDAAFTLDGGVLADYVGAVDEPATLARWFDAQVGVVEHGLFDPSLVDTIFIGASDEIHPPANREAP